jgi:DNA-directed RNA polymerase specialized sigma24 family protein
LYLQGWTQEEIAEMLNISRDVVRNLMGNFSELKKAPKEPTPTSTRNETPSLASTISKGTN